VAGLSAFLAIVVALQALLVQRTTRVTGGVTSVLKTSPVLSNVATPVNETATSDFALRNPVQEANSFRPVWRDEGMEKEEINFAVHEGIFLTLVMATRNDGYGGNSSRTRVATTLRMINYFAGKYGLAVELLFVEWNPPADRPAVWTTLPWMPNVAVVRVVTVPRWVHEAWSTPHVEVREREGQKVDFLSFVVDGVQVSAAV
jgi:hypothetical protein